VARTAGWEAVLTELVALRGDALTRYAVMLCGNRDDAADLVQTALEKTFGRLRNGFDVETAESYVRKAIASAYVDAGRKATRFRQRAHLFVTDDAVPAAGGASDERLDMRGHLDRLSPRERACIVHRYYGDLMVDDIARALGISSGAVKRYLSDGLAKLAAALDDARRELPHV
jgi:RNA polymerase sigma-70 factor (ECF subfamily)